MPNTVAWLEALRNVLPLAPMILLANGEYGTRAETRTRGTLGRSLYTPS
jgi:hypothetical protein